MATTINIKDQYWEDILLLYKSRSKKKSISLKSFTLHLALAKKIQEPFQHSSKASWKKLLIFFFNETWNKANRGDFCVLEKLKHYITIAKM